jgi:hypothetical protein
VKIQREMEKAGYFTKLYFFYTLLELATDPISAKAKYIQ